MLIIFLFVIASYLIGSIPTAYWIGKIFKGIDIRDHGSGNSGTTNTLRIMGWQYALPTLVLDFLKGFAVTFFANYAGSQYGLEIIHYKSLFGIAAIIGHVFPVFAGFRGGKGIATLAGAVTGISGWVILICLAVFIIITILTRYVSLSSLIATATLPVLFYFFEGNDLKLCVEGILIFVLVLFTHRKNIRRLVKGEENRISFRRKI